jgi:apolipoprotein N-acyltransferase
LGTVADPEVANTDAVLQKVADEAGATVVAGVGDEEAAVAHNQARVYASREAVETYNKEHLLPPFENAFVPGAGLLVLHRPGMTWGVAICKDMDFTNPARKNGQAGVGLMLVPGWDFDIDGFWHGHIAVMRGVEDGFSVVRAAKDGFLTVSDNRGRIVAEVASGSAPFTTLLADVPAGHEGTLFQLWGDWFGRCAILLLVIVLGRLWMVRRLAPVKTASAQLVS